MYAGDHNTPAVFRLEEHTDRLIRSAELVKMGLSVDKATLMAAQCAVLRENNLTEAYLRPMVFYGTEHLGLQTAPLSTHVMIGAWKWGAYFDEEAVHQGIKVCLSSYRRHDHRSVPCKAKANGLYVNSVLSLQEAAEKGCQEALLLDTEGNVAEGSSANVCIIRGNTLYTPESPHILDGITRESICVLAQDLGLSVERGTLILDDIYSADEMFFTGTAVEVAPVGEFDGKPVGSGQCGPKTRALWSAFREVTKGNNPKYSHWLTPISGE